MHYPNKRDNTLGAGGRIRTDEAYAAAYKTAPIDHYGTPAYVSFDRRLVDSVSRRPHSHFFNPVHDMKGGW